MRQVTLHTYILLLLLMPSLAFASDVNFRKEFVKEINKSFDLNHRGEITLNNRHGKVDVQTWDKPEVRIEVNILVRAKDEDSANEVFKRIQVDFSNDNDYVSAITDISQPKKSGGWSWASWSGGNNKDDFEINYEVRMPNKAKLTLKNKYGDAYVAETDGPVHAEIGYGSVRFEGVNNTLKLFLGYGDATVIKAEEITSEVKYSSFRVRNADNLDLETKYSKIFVDHAESIRAINKYDEYNLGDVGSLRTEGKYTKFHVQNINKLVANGKYTDYNVGNLKKEADVVVSYGGLVVETLESGFESLHLDGSYANFKIVTVPGASYKIDASASYGNIKLPQKLEHTYKRDSGHSNRYDGVMGSDPGNSVIKVKVNYGDISIR